MMIDAPTGVVDTPCTYCVPSRASCGPFELCRPARDGDDVVGRLSIGDEQFFG